MMVASTMIGQNNSVSYNNVPSQPINSYTQEEKDKWFAQYQEKGYVPDPDRPLKDGALIMWKGHYTDKDRADMRHTMVKMATVLQGKSEPEQGDYDAADAIMRDEGWYDPVIRTTTSHATTTKNVAAQSSNYDQPPKEVKYQNLRSGVIRNDRDRRGFGFNASDWVQV